MGFKFIIGATYVALTAVSFNVSALPSNIVDNGGYTTDTAEGLDWLDLSYTSGIAYNNAQTTAESYEGGGWGYATQTQVESLFDIMFPGVIYTFSGEVARVTGSPNPGEYVDMFGPTFTDEHNIVAHGFYMGTNSELIYAGVVTPGATPIVGYDTIVKHSDFTFLDPATALPGFGTWMVRVSETVPEPPIAILMASGLIVFGVVRRKSRI